MEHKPWILDGNDDECKPITHPPKKLPLLALEWVSHMLWSQEGHRPRLQLPSGCASNPLPGKAFGARPNAGSPRLRVGPNLFSSSDRFPYASENAGVERATSTPKHCAKRAPHPRPLHLDVPTPNPEAPSIFVPKTVNFLRDQVGLRAKEKRDLRDGTDCA